MYLWIVLATFIVLLYSFNIGVRADLDRVFAETKAQVVLTKFLAQHNAVKEYLNEQSPDKLGARGQYTESETERAAVSYFPGDGYNLSPDQEGNTLGADFKNTEAKATIENYLPVGFEPEADAVTKVFCFKNGDKTQNCNSSNGRSCCSDMFTGVYVVSFMPIPGRWFNPVTDQPHTDLIGAMSRLGGYGRDVGYIGEKNGKLVIVGGYQLPKGSTDENGNTLLDNAVTYREIWQAVKDDPDFINSGCNDANKHCLYAVQQIYG